MRAFLFSLITSALAAQQLPLVSNVEHQPLAAQVMRVVDALELLGEPLPPADVQELKRLAGVTSGQQAAVAGMQKILDRHCLVGININPESRVKVQEGPAKPELVEQGWRVIRTSARTGEGVDEAFMALAKAMVQ